MPKSIKSKHRTQLVLILLFQINFLFGQNDKNIFNFSFSNNGQLHKIMHDFYFNPVGEYEPGNDVYSFEQLQFKILANYQYLTKNDFSLGMDFGFGKRIDKYIISNVPEFPIGSEKQSYISFSLNVLKLFDLKQIQFVSGVGFPLSIISDYEASYEDNNPDQKLHFSTVTDGGMVYGVNIINGIRWFPIEYFFVETQIRFGFLNYALGGITESTIDFQDPIVFEETQYSYENKYNLISFTEPEFTFGFGFRF